MMKINDAGLVVGEAPDTLDFRLDDFKVNAVRLDLEGKWMIAVQEKKVVDGFEFWDEVKLAKCDDMVFAALIALAISDDPRICVLYPVIQDWLKANLDIPRFIP